MKERKIIKAFRIEPSIWQLFKEKSRAPTYLIREFIKWYLKYGDLWMNVKYLLSHPSSCLFCGKRFEGSGEEALEKGFSCVLVVRRSLTNLTKYSATKFWLCEKCSQKLEKILKNF